MPVEDHAGQVHEQREREFVDRWPWLLPLAAGIFVGAAIFEMLPHAIKDTGASAWGWLLAGVALFVAVREGLDYIGRHGLAWAATLGIWSHSFLEGAVTASGYTASLLTGLLVSTGLILHLIPELVAVIAVLGAAGVSRRQAIGRTVVTWGILLVGFVVTYVFLPGVSDRTLGAALAVGAGGFLYLGYVSWRERRWSLAKSSLVAGAGVALLAALALVTD